MTSERVLSVDLMLVRSQVSDISDFDSERIVAGREARSVLLPVPALPVVAKRLSNGNDSQSPILPRLGLNDVLYAARHRNWGRRPEPH
jgi:hypothetical protein